MNTYVKLLFLISLVIACGKQEETKPNPNTISYLPETQDYDGDMIPNDIDSRPYIADPKNVDLKIYDQDQNELQIKKVVANLNSITELKKYIFSPSQKKLLLTNQIQTQNKLDYITFESNEHENFLISISQKKTELFKIESKLGKANTPLISNLIQSKGISFNLEQVVVDGKLQNFHQIKEDIKKRTNEVIVILEKGENFEIKQYFVSKRKPFQQALIETELFRNHYEIQAPLLNLTKREFQEIPNDQVFTTSLLFPNQIVIYHGTKKMFFQKRIFRESKELKSHKTITLQLGEVSYLKINLSSYFSGIKNSKTKTTVTQIGPYVQRKCDAYKYSHHSFFTKMSDINIEKHLEFQINNKTYSYKALKKGANFLNSSNKALKVIFKNNFYQQYKEGFETLKDLCKLDNIAIYKYRDKTVSFKPIIKKKKVNSLDIDFEISTLNI